MSLPTWIPEQQREGGGSCQLRDTVKKRVADELERVQLLAALGELERYREWHGENLQRGDRGLEVAEVLDVVARELQQADELIDDVDAVVLPGLVHRLELAASRLRER